MADDRVQPALETVPVPVPVPIFDAFDDDYMYTHTVTLSRA